MHLHLVKLCVGVDTVEELQSYVAERLAAARREGRPAEQRHPTRMIPKRQAEILGGGSLYWVIKGQVQVRQRILDIRPFTDPEGIKRCHIVLEPDFILTLRQPRRPFQGWRYLRAEDAPADIAAGGGDSPPLPADLQRELAELGLL